MSKESYLKGEEKLKAITIIKTGLGVRMSPKEILERLQQKGIEISERTYRRLKLEIYESAGGTIAEIYQKQVGGTVFDELLSLEEMERRCWELYYSAKTPNEKFRSISQLRMISQDKMKFLKHFNISQKREKINYTQIRDDLREFDEEGEDKNLES
jgi:hypothetical protein